MHPADDPNTPPEILANLLRSHPDQVLANPVFSLLFLENLGWLEAALTLRHQQQVLNLPQLPRAVVEGFTRSSTSHIRAAAEMHISLGTVEADWERAIARRIAALSCTADDQRRLEDNGLIPSWLTPHLRVLPVKKAPLAVLRALTSSEHEEITGLSSTEKANLARRARRPEVLALLATEPDRTVLQAVADNPNTPIETLGMLAELPDSCMTILRNPSATVEVLTRALEAVVSLNVATHVSGRLSCLAWHPQVDATLAQRLWKDYRVAVPRLLPLPILLEQIEAGKLAKTMALGRDDTPLWLRGEAVMEGATHRSAYLTWFCGLLATETPKRLTDAARSEAWFTRFAAAIHPLTKVKSLERLSNDANRYIRAAAQNRLDDPNWRFLP